MSPDGIKYGNLLPNAKRYSNPVGGVMQAWRGKARWFTNLCEIKSQDKDSGTLMFDKSGTGGGCIQGGAATYIHTRPFLTPCF
jgi:hypothetical protein